MGSRIDQLFCLDPPPNYEMCMRNGGKYSSVAMAKTLLKPSTSQVALEDDIDENDNGQMSSREDRLLPSEYTKITCSMMLGGGVGGVGGGSGGVGAVGSGGGGGGGFVAAPASTTSSSSSTGPNTIFDEIGQMAADYADAAAGAAATAADNNNCLKINETILNGAYGMDNGINLDAGIFEQYATITTTTKSSQTDPIGHGKIIPTYTHVYGGTHIFLPYILKKKHLFFVPFHLILFYFAFVRQTHHP